MSHRNDHRVAFALLACVSCAALTPACSSPSKPGGGSPNGAAGGSGSSNAGGATSTAAGAGGTAGGVGGALAASAGSSDNGGSAGASAGGGLAGASGGAVAPAEWSQAFPTFTKHTIASFSAGYATLVADIDHDGLPDVVALSSGSAGLVWFKNPSWTKYAIATGATQLIFMAPYDIDGDGDLDLALISDFDMNDTTSGGTVSWAEAPPNPTQNQNWDLHPIDAVPTSHRLRWADIDGDGKKELLDLPLFGEGSSGDAHAGAVQLKAYTIPKDPKTAWTSKILDDQHLEVAHGIEVVDWDGDQAEDIITAANDGVDLFRPSLGANAQHLGSGKEGQAPNKGSSEVALGSLGGPRFIATIEPWHGTDAVIYTPSPSGNELWTRLVLGSPFEHGHGLAVADFNGDGFDEVVGGGGQGKLAQYIYRYLPSSQSWEQIELDLGGVAVSGIDVKDLNLDGAVDIVTIGGSPTNNVVWYENSR